MGPRDWLRLSRLPLAPTAAGDAVACALLARGPGLASKEGAPASFVDLLVLAATSVLVYASGMIGNDVADRRRDATIHPERPIPSRRISPTAASVVAALCAVGAIVVGGGPLGSREAVVAAIGLALVYDFGVKRSVVAGAAAMGLVRAANGAVGVLPLVLSGSTSPWALLGPAVVGLYSAGITVLSTSEDAPASAPRRLFVARVAAFLAFAGAGALSVVGAESLSFGLFLASGIGLSVAFGRVPRKRPVRVQVLEMLLGFYWLEAILSTGGFPGSSWEAALGSLGVALASVFLSQVAIRALRPRPA